MYCIYRTCMYFGLIEKHNHEWKCMDDSLYNAQTKSEQLTTSHFLSKPSLTSKPVQVNNDIQYECSDANMSMM